MSMVCALHMSVHVPTQMSVADSRGEAEGAPPPSSAGQKIFLVKFMRVKGRNGTGRFGP